MILHFPTLDILKLALTSGAVPEPIRNAGARAAWDDQGNVWVLPSGELAKSSQRDLARLGVQFPKAALNPLDHQVASWLELLPLECASYEVGEKTPILFELEFAQLPALVGEMLRLGNDRQSFRWVSNGSKETALLRVLGPPYYTLLRALDGPATENAPRAYREQSPEVWCQLGFRYPLAAHLQAPAGTLLLLKPPRAWVRFEEAKFRDIYDVLDFTLPQAPTALHESADVPRLQVPVRLTAAGDAPAELWVLRDEAVAQLEEFVQQADSALTQRLAFAVAQRQDEHIVVLRVRPSKQPPPVLLLDAQGFRTALKLPNLFIPVRTRLQPPLRRDAVARLLAPDPEQITWLNPLPDGKFTPETLPDKTFRPLSQWVDHVLDREHEPLTAWIEASRFDFEAFVCRGDEKPKEPSEPKPPRKEKAKRAAAKKEDKAETPPAKTDPQAPDTQLPALDLPPTELEEQLRQREAAFLAHDGPLDAPERQALWPELAALQAELGHDHDAAISWTHAFWEQRTSGTWASAWFQSQRKTSPAFSLQKVLAKETPTHADLRCLAAYLVLADGGPERLPPDELRSLKANLGRVQHFLQGHEGLLGVRAVWLAWGALHRMAGGDVLSLARARDRMLERLFLGGLTPDLDLPAFLRFQGRRSGQRFQVLRAQLLRLRQMALDWSSTGSLPGPGTAGYIHLLFAYALARLGEVAESRDVMHAGLHAIPNRDDIHTWLCDAFAARMQQAVDNKPGERLPEELIRRLDQMETPDYLEHLSGPNLDRERQRLKVDRYKIEKMRAHLRVLEPHEKIDPYRRWSGHFVDSLARELAALVDIHDAEHLIDKLRALLREKKRWAKGKSAQTRVLAAALELAPRLGEAFAEEILTEAGQILEAAEDRLTQALVLEKGLFLAAHYDRRAQVEQVLEHLHRLLEGNLPAPTMESLLGQTFQGLRRLGMPEEVGRILQRMSTLAHEQQAKLDRKKLALSDEALSREISVLERLLLQIAGGWLYFGQPDKARPILDASRDLLFGEVLTPLYQTALARAYCQTLGQAPLEFGLGRLMELFRRLRGVRDMFTTHTHFSLSRLEVVEAAVLALVGDETAFDPDARRLLDEDEYLVRRRIHRDVRAAL